MKACDVVDEAFFRTAKAASDAERTLDVSASQLFASFEDGPSWMRWVPAIRSVQWTSPKPFGVGTTRTVTLVGGIELDEHFWAWEHERRVGFCVTASSSGSLRALIECYDITPIDAQRCRLRWRMALALRGPLSAIESAMRPSLAPVQQRLMAKLEGVAAGFPNIRSAATIDLA